MKEERDVMLCWMTVNWIIVVKVEIESYYIDLNESVVKEERERDYAMLNECKSCVWEISQKYGCKGM